MPDQPPSTHAIFGAAAYCRIIIGLIAAAVCRGRHSPMGIRLPGQIGFQEAVTPIAHELQFFHNWILLPIITAICLFVLGLLIYVIFRFNEKANPAPARRPIIPALKSPGP